MKYNLEDLKRVQRIELEILEEVIRVCNENNINYFLEAGTLLGAMRHSGFIPWDDDIDIGMLRSDYDKFMEIAPNKLTNGFTLQHFSNDKKTKLSIRKNNSITLECYLAFMEKTIWNYHLRKIE